MENYDDVWKEPAGYDYLCGAFDEDDDSVECEECDYMLHCDSFGNYVCDNCGKEYSREEHFSRIGAQYKPLCLKCEENYPQCKSSCEVYDW